MIKNVFPIFLLLQSITAWAQWSDSFDDGWFCDDSRVGREVAWTGDCGNFKVNEDLQLQLFSTSNYSPAQLRTPSSMALNTRWEFDVNMAFNPTAFNYTKVYLVSDEADLTDELNGLFVRIGYTNKNICLVQSKKGSSDKTLITGETKRLDRDWVSVAIRAELDAAGKLNLYSRLGTEADFHLEGSCTIQNVPVCHWFGLTCIYSSTRSKHFFFDNFAVQTLDDKGSGGEPAADLPREGDIVFSEIMANPGTGSSNPEYVELYNTSHKSFRSEDCLFFYGDRSYALPEGEIAPHSYFVLCAKSAVDRFPGANVNGLTSWPSLVNSGKLLMFGNTQNQIISWFDYSDAMYRDSAKKTTGGWSLECIDLTNKSNTAENWSASVDTSGGTPGKANSIQAANPDITPPAIRSASLPKENQVNITFSKPMNRTLLLDAQSYSIDEPDYRITGLEANDPQATELTLQLNVLPPQGEPIELFLPGLKDRSGNGLADRASVVIGNAFEASPQDVVINEILFNEPAGGCEYVELYNRSTKILDLRSLSITSRKPSDGSFNTPCPLTGLPLFLHPQTYILVSRDRNLVCSFFNCREESLSAEPTSMPSLANTSGCAVILNNATDEIIDQFYYTETLHSHNPSDKKGIALERIHPDLPTNEPGTWMSATGQSGHGTPGYVNSQYSDPTRITNPHTHTISIEYPTQRHEPYGIRYTLSKPGYNSRLFIYDASGRKVSTVLNNERLSQQGVIYWNGQGAPGRKLPAGIYIVYLELFDLSEGDVYKLKTPISVR